MSWWDYGYQITAMANRTILVDNNTWNNTHISRVGQVWYCPYYMQFVIKNNSIKCSEGIHGGTRINTLNQHFINQIKTWSTSQLTVGDMSSSLDQYIWIGLHCQLSLSIEHWPSIDGEFDWVVDEVLIECQLKVIDQHLWVDPVVHWSKKTEDISCVHYTVCVFGCKRNDIFHLKAYCNMLSFKTVGPYLVPIILFHMVCRPRLWTT